MTDYIFADQQGDQELARLRLIEEALDGVTISHLESTGVASGWHCLELGAGAGSILNWMGQTVGASGRAVGIDRDTTHLQQFNAPPFQVIDGEFPDVAIDSLFDLAHCRYVLIHNHNSEPILSALGARLRPGGYLVAEEPDFTSAQFLNPAGSPSRRRLNNAIVRTFQDRGLNPAFGLSLPESIARQGLEVLETDARIHLARGNSAMARMMASSTAALSDMYVGTGEVSEPEVQEFISQARDPECRAVYYSTISVVAVKPT